MVANFAINNYVIGVTAEHGTVTGAGNYDHFTTATLVATPATGYHFVNWTEGGEVVSNEATYTFEVSGAKTLVANFAINNYAIGATAEYGTVTGAGNYDHFATATLVATPATGYHFVNWTEGNETVSTEATYTFEVSGARTLVAHFDTNEYQLTVNMAASEDVRGSVSGTQTVKHFLNYTISATPAAGYHFVQWNDGISDNPRTVTLTENTTYTAIFDTTHAELAWSAEAFTGYTSLDFNKWKPTLTNPHNVVVRFGVVESGIDIDSETGVIGTVSDDAHYVHATGTYHVYAVHETDDVYLYDSVVYALTVGQSSSIWLLSNISEGGETGFPDYSETPTLTHRYTLGFFNVAYVADGYSVQIQATPATGYHFTEWQTGNNVSGYTTVTTDAIYTFTANDVFTIKNFLAVFDTNEYQLNVSVAETSEGMGSVTGSTTAKHFLEYEITATPNYGYHFVNWTNAANGAVLGTSETLTVSPTADINIVANFTYNTYTVNIVSGNPAMGSVSNGATVNYLTNVPVSATPNYGYHFVNWTEDDTVYSTAADTVVKALSMRTLTANFDYNQYTVTAASADETMGTVGGTATVNYLQTVTLTATPAEGYHLVNWTAANGDVLGAENTITVQALRDSTITATFAINLYNITLAYDATRGTVTNDDANDAVVTSGFVFENVEHGTVLHLTATVDEGSRFTGWNDGTATVNTASIAYTATATRTLTANFIDAGSFQVILNNNDVMGTVTGAGEHHADSEVIITATANYGYHFVAWVDENGDSIYTTTHSFTMPQSEVEFTAVYDYNKYTVTVQSANTVMGSAEGTATVDYLTNVPVSATANYGYHFTAWINAAGDTIAVTPNAMVQALRDSVITANFGYNQYTVTGISVNDEIGTVAGTATVDYLQTVTLTATPAIGYHFVNWTNAAGAVIGEANTIEMQATDDITVTANFDTNVYNVTVNVNAVEGSVEGPATIKHFLSGTYTATATPCYHFVNWTDANGTVLGTDLTYTLNQPTADVVINANFALNIYTGDTTVNVCDEFVWHGITYNETPAVAPTFVYQNANGCDSTVTMNLTIRHSNTGDTAAVACDSFEWYGVTYTTTPTVAPTHLFTNAAGCDSTVTLTLTVNHSNTGDTTAVACDSFDWNGMHMTESGDTNYTYTNVNNCDSVVTLHLTVNPIFAVLDAQTICASELPYTWNGVTFTEAGTQPVTLQTVNGCDSVVTMTLTVNLPTYSDTTATSCVSFDWNGMHLTESGDTIYVTTNAAGCDSIRTLHLTINQPTFGDTTASAYDAFDWYGMHLTESADTTYVTTNAAGCDSTVTLHLTINHYDSVTVILSVNNAAWGSTNPVAGTYRFYPGETATATAIVANNDCVFTGWVVDGDTVSHDVMVSMEILPAMAGMTYNVVATFFSNVGVESAEYSNINIYSTDSKVVVKGAEGMTIYIYDVNGRCMARRANAADTETFQVETTGVILVKAGNAPAKRVIVVR